MARVHQTRRDSWRSSNQIIARRLTSPEMERLWQALDGAAFGGLAHFQPRPDPHFVVGSSHFVAQFRKESRLSGLDAIEYLMRTVGKVSTSGERLEAVPAQLEPGDLEGRDITPVRLHFKVTPPNEEALMDERGALNRANSPYQDPFAIIGDLYGAWGNSATKIIKSADIGILNGLITLEPVDQIVKTNDRF